MTEYYFIILHCIDFIAVDTRKLSSICNQMMLESLYKKNHFCNYK